MGMMKTFGPYVFSATNTAVSKTDADTTETTIYTLAIPGGTLGANDTMRITFRATFPNSATTKNWRVKLGGTNVTGTAIQVTTSASLIYQIIISNRNATNSQIASHATSTGYGAGTGLTTMALDMTASQNLTISAQWGTAGTGSNSMTLESVMVEILPG